MQINFKVMIDYLVITNLYYLPHNKKVVHVDDLDRESKEEHQVVRLGDRLVVQELLFVPVNTQDN